MEAFELRDMVKARNRIRTGDPFLTMEVLYQLSYPGTSGRDWSDRHLGLETPVPVPRQVREGYLMPGP